MKISTVSRMRALDRAAIERFGIGAELLMENAGQAVYHVISREYGIEGRRFVVFCGVGHNGGDGLVVARLLHANGGAVRVFVLGDPGRFDGPARLNYGIVSRLPVDVKEIRSVEAARADVERCDGIVDAILGTGLTRHVTGLYREVIDLINASGRTVFSVDIPSGVHGDTAAVMGAAVRADYTVTFGLPKTGNVLSPGFGLCGKLFVCHISFPPSLYETDPASIETNDPIERPAGKQEARVGETSKALFIDGSSGCLESLDLAASAFRRTARGLARPAVPTAIVWPIGEEEKREILSVPLYGTGSRDISVRNIQVLFELSRTTDMVLLVSSLSPEKETGRWVRELVGRIPAPLLITGKVISAFDEVLRLLKYRKAATILMLNEGNMSCVAKVQLPGADACKVELVRQTACELNATVVLQDVHSLIAFPDGRVFINMSGDRVMPPPGSSDILAGAIAAMAGLRLGVEAAVRKGVFVEGLAADLAFEEKGEHRAPARDVLDYLPRAVRMDLRGLSATLKERYRGARIV